ncbi:ImmA/IrrE family metallo-endopeptidase [Fulvivirgaceae bacterium BMA12]|uniref:ImmA/IrrE family metallo-endopeptidase n=1 Tax=Agaribacillus aureus TaxID=3051825 RepID=A0ABT8LD74_9BACT|nr:ImmA/IrrE family metallo-endopeptidase [Fulvivirgaceae bacterium BMA12]
MTKNWKEFQSPGEALNYFLNDENWTQDDFSYIMSISLKHANELIKDKKSISIDVARLLENAFDWPAEDWMNLSIRYQLEAESKDDKAELVKTRAELSKYMPLNELVKKGWLRYKSASQLKKQIRTFWNIPTNQALDLSFLEEKVADLKYRTSEAFNDKFKEFHAIVWAQMALNHARKIKVSRYDRAALQELMNELHTYTKAPNGIKRFLSNLEKVGVKFVFLSHLSKTYLDGAAFLSPDGPVVALTGRYDRIDNFWFTLAHELSHVLLHLTNGGSSSIFIDDTTKKGRDSKEEKEANGLAEEVLLYEEIVDHFEDSSNYITVDKIHAFSNEFGLHPAIVIGILAFNEVISYSNLHHQRFKESIRDKIPQKYRAEI